MSILLQLLLRNPFLLTLRPCVIVVLLAQIALPLKGAIKPGSVSTVDKSPQVISTV